MIRPEEVQLSYRKGTLEARVEQKMFLGDATVYFLNIYGQTLRAKSQQREEFEVGDRLYIDISGKHLTSASMLPRMI